LPALSAWQGLFTHGQLEPGQRVLVTGATGGVGHLAVQLARRVGAEVLTDVGDVREPFDLVFDTVGGDVLAQCKGRRVVSVAQQPPGDGIYFVVAPDARSSSSWRSSSTGRAQSGDRLGLRPRRRPRRVRAQHGAE
jgi:D-arabinose 1-dehydrogenase-like Zn-dependent alcohol dehydrogenase